MPMTEQGGTRAQRARERRVAVAVRSEVQGRWQASFLIYLLTGLLVIGLGTAISTYLPLP